MPDPPSDSLNINRRPCPGLGCGPGGHTTSGHAGIVARSARHILVEEGTRSSFTLPSTSLFTLGLWVT